MSIAWNDLAIPKSSPQQSKHPERLTEAQFRAAVWRRDHGRSRVTGEPLSKSDDNWRFLGQVCHLKTKGAHPALKYDPDNAILMSAQEHWLSDHRGGRLLRLYDAETNEPATSAARKILFVRLDQRGTVLWTRVR